MEDVSEASGQGADKRQLSGRIHILGLGNVGSFVAHALASKQSRPPMTLLLHKLGIYADWLAKKKSISINSGGMDVTKTGFDVNVLEGNTWHSIPYLESDNDTQRSLYDQVENKPGLDEIVDELDHSQKDDEAIECLIVTTKAHHTVNALKSVKNRLTPNSTVLLLQNGMGTLEEVKENVFPDASERPNFMLGIISHGLLRLNPFQVAHTGLGTTIFSPVENKNGPAYQKTEKDWAPSTKYLLRTLTLAPHLVAVAEHPSNLIQYQLEKLAMNCVINPFTVLLDCENGELLDNYAVTRSMRLLLMEMSAVIRAMPELQGIPGIDARFSTERLRQLTVGVAKKTAKNTSSMQQDVLGGRKTEIDYLNGYIVRRGEELGIKCALNYMIMQLVLSKSAILTKREEGAIPLVGEEMDQFDL